MEDNSNKIQVIVTPEREGLLKDGGVFTVMVSLKAPFFEETKRAPVDIVTVIDRSGSMEGIKMELVKETLKFVVKQLRVGDNLSIVLYDHEVDTLLPPTNMNSEGKEKANYSISGICARGSTDLCAGLIKGIELIKTQKKNEVASLLLFTDGLVNAGIQSIDAIKEQIVKHQQNDVLPCTLHTFGFGSDHAVNILKNISEQGNGSYFFIENKDTIPNAFADCLGGLLSVVGQNLVLEIQGNNGATIDKIETTFKSSLNHGKGIVTIGDIQSEEERDILCKLQTPNLEENQSIQILVSGLSYFNVLTSKQEESSAVCILSESVNYENLPKNEKIDVQKNRILTTEVLAKARTMADLGEYEAGRGLINQTIAILKASISRSHSFVLALIRDLEDSLSGLQDRHTYSTYGTYQMASYVSSHIQQRATHTTQSYTTSSRSVMQSRLNQ